jgi:hypothetical protein
VRKGDDRQYGLKKRKQVFTYLRSLMQNLANALILSGIRRVEQYIVNVLANKQYIGRVPEGRTIYWSSRQRRTIYWSERNNNILYCNIQCRVLQYFRPTIYCIVNNILQYIVSTIYFCAPLGSIGGCCGQGAGQNQLQYSVDGCSQVGDAQCWSCL